MKLARPLLVPLLVVACGKRGDPLPPIRIVPQPVTELRLAQRGATLETAYVVPRVATDGSRLGVIDIEIARAQKTGDFDKLATRTRKRAAPGEALVDQEDLPPLGTTVRVAARAISKGRASNRTGVVSLTVIAPPLTPTELLGEVGPSGNVLRWSYPGPIPTPLPLPTPSPGPSGAPSVSPSAPPQPIDAIVSLTPSPPAEPDTRVPPTRTAPAPTSASPPAPGTDANPSPAPAVSVGPPSVPGTRPPGVSATPAPRATPKPVGFLVYRRSKEGSYSRPLRNDVLTTMLFEDTTVEPGQEWCYVTRFAMSVDPIVESAGSPEVCLVFKDIAAPAAPVGVSVFLHVTGVEVSWSPSGEADLAAYRVYRRAPPGEAAVLVGEVAAPETTLKDPGAKTGITNVYTVTAVDTAGNEGPASAPVQVRP